MDRIYYKCKKCSWSASVPEAWGDLKPQVCGNKKCLHSFRKYPDDLSVTLPEKVVAPKVIPKVEPEVKPQKKWEKPASKKEEILET